MIRNTEYFSYSLDFCKSRRYNILGGDRMKVKSPNRVEVFHEAQRRAVEKTHIPSSIKKTYSVHVVSGSVVLSKKDKK